MTTRDAICLVYLGCGISMVLESIVNGVLPETYTKTVRWGIKKHPNRRPALLHIEAQIGVLLVMVATLGIWPALYLRRKLRRKP